MPMKGRVEFLYNGMPFIFIPDPPFVIVANDYQANCLAALKPVLDEIERSGGKVTIDLLDYCKDIQVRCSGIDPELVSRVVDLIPKERPSLPVGTYDYIKRQAYNAKRRYQRRLR